MTICTIVLDMYSEGWCDDCKCDWHECYKLGYCKGGKYDEKSI